MTTMTPEEMIAEYKEIHKNPSLSKGTALLKHIPEIARLVNMLDCKTILDYGCGKAYFWKDFKHWRALMNNVPRSVQLYDPAIPEFEEMPEGRFDMVICTDVLEHVHPSETDNFLKTLFLYTRQCLFINVSTIPAKKTFKDGTNLHVNLRTIDQWEKKIHEIRSWYGDKYKSFPAVVVRFDEEIGRF